MCLFSCSYNDDHRNLSVITIAFLIKSINYKSCSKTNIENILHGTVIVTLFFRLTFNSNAIRAMRGHILFRQRYKTWVLCCEYKYPIIIQ